ncbi:hypothetical protein N7532_008873 [Penicillium argentinense]|uniref:Fringe-like glycosyltransferase domain-containing protein n=1 Tax=Penicillium argentinense TaxID=1131581 RepID=A0A9W9EYE8_9EURO|nr:uncharacterized protein N7532_008873 [Penicillium argentinense]KAJ5090189.1 hypothetical protein N7532_008873 [Penicillium argentinense]
MLFNRDGAIPASWAWKKMLRFVVVFIAVAGFAALLWPSPKHHTAPMRATSNITISPQVQCDPDVDMLHRLNIKKLADYTRREIVVDVNPEPLPLKQKVEEPLWDAKLKAPGNSEQGALQDGCSVSKPLTLQIPPRPKSTDASHIDFGVATTVSRLNESLDQFAHWAGYSRARIFALIEPDETKGKSIQQVKVKAENLGINLFITESEDDYLHRYFALIPILESNMREQTRWGCIIDDDTFFLSMPALVDALGHYDDTKPMYIGGLSEGIPQIAVFGLIAFGGAGVFMSRPLLSDLGTVYDECEQMTFTGDRRIANCIYQYTTTRLTVDHRLHQLDLMKDASGFFEAGREPPLSVHHWKSWFTADMPKLSVISEAFGEDVLLRQWQFSDEWILTNGFSVIQYSLPLDPGDITMEMTWEPHNGATDESYLHELGPLRRKDDDKISFQLEDAVIEPNGRVTQWYIQRDKAGDQVLELSWRKR